MKFSSFFLPSYFLRTLVGILSLIMTGNGIASEERDESLQEEERTPITSSATTVIYTPSPEASEIETIQRFANISLENSMLTMTRNFDSSSSAASRIRFPDVSQEPLPCLNLRSVDSRLPGINLAETFSFRPNIVKTMYALATEKGYTFTFNAEETLTKERAYFQQLFKVSDFKFGLSYTPIVPEIHFVAATLETLPREILFAIFTNDFQATKALIGVTKGLHQAAMQMITEDGEKN